MRGSSWLLVIVTAGSLVRGCVLLSGPVMCGCGEPARADVTRHQLRAMIDAASHVGLTGPNNCPDLDEVERRAGVDPVDAWGHPWTLRCDTGAVVIVSRGEDGVPGTLDDIELRDD